MPRRKNTKRSPGLSKNVKIQLYSTRHTIWDSIEDELGLRLAIDTYLQDPRVAREAPEIAFDDQFHVTWEPGLSDGPTSARFAVVDYNNDADTLIPPAIWQEEDNAFVDTKGRKLDRKNAKNPQFHQVNLWAVAQRALDYFENSHGLGRTIRWGFEGNRLLLVPHAGYGQNAYYDRQSKSLQFYYFDSWQSNKRSRIFTCLSTDIINHEFGHAILDGIRPLLHESLLLETAAFHEFTGDLSAILLSLRNNGFRGYIASKTQGDLSKPSYLSNLAEQFGEAVTNKAYLRSGRNKRKMSSVAGSDSHHRISEVLTGTVFDIIVALSKQYQLRERKSDGKKHTAPAALGFMMRRVPMLFVQPLDLLPPMDVTFSDYAHAILRWDEIANPFDEHGYRQIVIDAFKKRGILSAKEAQKLSEHGARTDAPRWTVPPSIEEVAISKDSAYRFVDDNREELFIPANVDVVIHDVCIAKKMNNRGTRLPEQIIVQYVWRQDVRLTGPRFDNLDGRNAELICGGTLVFDRLGNLLSWFRKSGSDFVSRQPRAGAKRTREEATRAKTRVSRFLDTVASRLGSGKLHLSHAGEHGMIAARVAPFLMVDDGHTVKFALAPHFHLHHEDEEYGDGSDDMGGREWEISS